MTHDNGAYDKCEKAGCDAVATHLEDGLRLCADHMGQYRAYVPDILRNGPRHDFQRIESNAR